MVARGVWPTVQHLPQALMKIVKLKLLSIAIGIAKLDEVVLVLLVAK
jgi:hypothetical protein